jgi:hypothetical protein
MLMTVVKAITWKFVFLAPHSKTMANYGANYNPSADRLLTMPLSLVRRKHYRGRRGGYLTLRECGEDRETDYHGRPSKCAFIRPKLIIKRCRAVEVGSY